MAKLPWMKFYPSDYLLDTQILTPAARGVWMDLICYCWRSPDRGSVSYFIPTWSTLLRINEEMVKLVFSELSQCKICDIVTDAHGSVTVTCRRMLREERSRNNAMLRKRKQRVTQACHASVTGEKSEVRSHISEVRSQKSELKEKKKSMPLRADDESFWNSLKENLAYKHIDLAVERGKMAAWLALPKNKHRKLTRAFALNWLNKIEPLLSGDSGKVVTLAPVPPFPGPEDPIGRNLWRKAYGNPS